MGPRAYTQEETKEIFLRRIRGIAKYWAELPSKSNKERCDGVAFSILSLIDGCNADFPAINLVTSPHPTDKEFCKSHGWNWYEPNTTINEEYALHEFYFKKSEALINTLENMNF